MTVDCPYCDCTMAIAKSEYGTWNDGDSFRVVCDRCHRHFEVGVNVDVVLSSFELDDDDKDE